MSEVLRSREHYFRVVGDIVSGSETATSIALVRAMQRLDLDQIRELSEDLADLNPDECRALDSLVRTLLRERFQA